MSERTFVQWQAFIGPRWLPKQADAAWNFAIAADRALAGVAGTLTGNLASGATSLAMTGLTPPAKGGLWVGPNGAGQGWEYVGHTGYAGGAASGLTREPTETREHNGIHSTGAPVRFWMPLDMNDGKIHWARETNQTLTATTWTAELSGITAPMACLRRHHAIYVRARYAYDQAWTPLLLGWIEEFTVADDYRRYAQWKLKITSVAGMLEKQRLDPVKSGEQDLARNGQIVKSDVPMPMRYKEQFSGDYTAAEPTFIAKNVIDGDDETLFIAERFIGDPGERSEGSYDGGWYGQVFVSRAHITIPPGLGKGYRWLQLQLCFGNKLWDGYLCSKAGPISPYLALNGKADHQSRIFVVENLNKFSAANPLADPTRIVEVGPTMFDRIDLTSDALAYWGGPMGGDISWHGNAIRWGNDPDVEAHKESDEATNMPGGCIPAPAIGMTIHYHKWEDATEGRHNFRVDYGDYAGYEPSDGVDPWFLLQLPSMGLVLRLDIATANYTGYVQVWDGAAPNVNGFPESGTIQIGAEQITYNGKSNGNLYLTARGVNGTTAVPHYENDPVYFVDWDGQATDAYAISELRWKRQGSTIYPRDFKIYLGKSIVQPRYPTSDDEDPNHEYHLDYNLPITVTGNTNPTWSLTLAPAQRVVWVLMEVSRMTANPARPRLNTFQAILDTSTFDPALWLDETADIEDCFLRLLANAGIPFEAISLETPLASTQPFKMITGQGTAWSILTDLADYTSVFIEITPLSHISLRTNSLWRLDQSQDPVVHWTRRNAADVQFVAERSGPIGQVQLKWMKPDGTDGGTVIYPATIDPVGDYAKLRDSFYPDVDTAESAAQRRYLVAKYPYTLAVQAAMGDDELEPGQFHSLEWVTDAITLNRSGFVSSVDHQIEMNVWSSAVRIMQLREAY